MQDNKCSWLVVQALERASADQKKIIEVTSLQHSHLKFAVSFIASGSMYIESLHMCSTLVYFDFLQSSVFSTENTKRISKTSTRPQSLILS